MKFKKDFKIYIIGYIPTEIGLTTISKFLRAEEELQDMRATIINPLRNLCNDQIEKAEAHKINMNNLLASNAVYILNEKVHYGHLPELKMALKFNLLILHQVIH